MTISWLHNASALPAPPHSPSVSWEIVYWIEEIDLQGVCLVDNMMVLAVAGSIISAASVFIFMQFRRYDEQKAASDKILQATTEFEAVKAKLQGYIKFNEYLAPAKQQLVEQSKTFLVSVVREYVHLERFYRDKHKIKADLAVMGRYTVEFTLAIDLRTDNLDIALEGIGICVKAGQPTLSGPPVIKASSYEVSVPGVLVDERPFTAEVNQKFREVIQRHGLAMAREDTVRALCKAKMIDALRDFLSNQPGVRQVPTIMVVFR